MDLYPNAAFVEAVRKDGYEEYSSDVFHQGGEASKYYFVKKAIDMTSMGWDAIRYLEVGKHEHTRALLLNYYNTLIESGVIKKLGKKNHWDGLGADSNDGIVEAYILAVNSKEAVISGKYDFTYDTRRITKWPTEMQKWWPKGMELFGGSIYPPLIKPKSDYIKRRWLFNAILFTPVKGEGFPDFTKSSSFMNWGENPLNR